MKKWKETGVQEVIWAIIIISSNIAMVEWQLEVHLNITMKNTNNNKKSSICNSNNITNSSYNNNII
jgi:hypothetical protein